MRYVVTRANELQHDNQRVITTVQLGKVSTNSDNLTAVKINVATAQTAYTAAKIAYEGAKAQAEQKREAMAKAKKTYETAKSNYDFLVRQRDAVKAAHTTRR